MAGQARALLAGPVTAEVIDGPSAGRPEHDVSVLTGLQAGRCLNQGGIPATGLYWGRGGDFHDVGAGREAASFRDGVPAGAQPLVAGLGPGAGRGFGRPRKLGLPVPVPLRAAVICCHGAPGECGRLQGLLDLMACPTPARARRGPRS